MMTGWCFLLRWVLHFWSSQYYRHPKVQGKSTKTVCVRSSLRDYAASPLFGVSRSVRTKSHSVDSHKLTYNCCFTVTRPGVLQDSGTIKPGLSESFDWVMVFSELCWGLVVWNVKLSVLAFYWRLFSAKARSIRVVIWVLSVFVTCWVIAVVCSRPIIVVPELLLQLWEDCIMTETRWFITIV